MYFNLLFNLKSILLEWDAGLLFKIYNYVFILIGSIFFLILFFNYFIRKGFIFIALYRVLKKLFKKDKNVDNNLNTIHVYENKLTNLGVQRKYLEGYLKNHSMVHLWSVLCVRQLRSTVFGINSKVDVFSIEQKIVAYKNLRSEIFEPILSVISVFDLAIFQRHGSI